MPSREQPSERAWIAALAVLLPSFSLLTVLRHTREHLQADGVMQAVMSVQDPTLFYWGQDRFAPVVSWLASPVADPMANLWVCLLLESAAFHGVLLVLARLVTPAIADREWRSTTITFLVLTFVSYAVLASATISQFAIDTQPYSPSLLAVLGAFVLWRRNGRWRVAGAALAWLACGLNPTAILVLAALALVAAVRTGQWWRWIALGVVCCLSQVSWMYLASVFAEPANPWHKELYFAFSRTDYRARVSAIAHNGFDAVRLPWLAALTVVAAVVTVLMPSSVRRRLALRGALVVAFAAAFAALFAGNAWVAANAGHVRYFLPVVLAGVMLVGVPLAWAGLQAPYRLGMPVLVGALGLGIVLASWGPLTSPTRADVLTASAPIAEFAEAEGVVFVAGDYWTVWPTLLPMLDEGRHAAFVTGLRTGSDPDSYRELFERARAAGTPRALCIDADPGVCADHLALWTAPGWSLTGETCPDPVVPRPAGHESPIRLCVVLELR